ncbi:hypothetical protein TcCL_NonESM08972 [Trypanosoma cruzi]|nr:hypothetical protein TcCL_NonESM08972 [Trypanosoma cruzi]
MPGTWASSPQSGGRTERNSRRKRKAHTPHDRRLTVWRNSIPGVDADIVPEVADPRTGAMRLLPPIRQAREHCGSQGTPCVGGAVPFFTEETGPPLPPPEPLPDKNSATSC